MPPQQIVYRGNNDGAGNGGMREGGSDSQQRPLPTTASSPTPHDQPTSSTDAPEYPSGFSSAGPIGRAASATSSRGGGEPTEEINTREVALRVSNELRKYSIPQAVFAQRVLGRSQGTLSDLLRNPKPWSKLKSGRETFRRMWKWLSEPEYDRMATLRLLAAAAGEGMSSCSYVTLNA